MFGLNELLRIDRGIGQTKDLIRREENLEGLMKKVDTLFVEVAGRNHIDGKHGDLVNISGPFLAFPQLLCHPIRAV